jgi:hypothetical protein
MSGDDLLLPSVSALDGTETFRANRSSGASVQVPVTALRAEVQTLSLPAAATTGIMVPYYVYPTDVYNNVAFQALLALLRTYPAVPCIVILNPSSGPGTSWDGNYAVAIKQLKAAGAVVAGYVSSAYGVRAQALVEADIRGWLSVYSDAPVDALFIDEQPWAVTEAHVALYEGYVRYAHERGLYPVIANPGTNQQETWFKRPTADVIVVHEAGAWPAEADMKGNFSGGHAQYRRSMRAALVYDQATLSLSELATLRKYVAWLYITDDVLSPNPWDSVSAHLPSLFAALATSGPGVLTSAADDAAAAAAGVPVGGLYRTASAVKVRVS